MKKLLGVVLALMVGGAGLAACGGDSGGGGGDAAGADCPVGALDDVEGTVEITFWHGMNQANETALEDMVEEFHATQDTVRVRLVNQTGYKELFDKFVAGLSTGDLPDLAQGQEIRLQQLLDTGASLPIQACIDADDYDTSDFVERTIDYYTVEDVVWNLPFNPSNPILLYNKNQFRDAGLDPDAPPSSLEEVKEYAVALKESGVPYPMAIKMDPWFIEQWSAKAGIDYVNEGNGRDGRATEAIFDNEVGLEIFTFLREMVDEGLAITNPSEGQQGIDNLLAVGAGNAAMTIDSSAGLGTIFQLLEAGEYQNVEGGVGPLPGPVGDGGVLVGGASLFISNDSSDERQAAAWEFIKFATSPEQQAKWSAATGYVPVRKSAVDEPALVERWAELPELKVAYDQLLEGVENSATAGAALGPYEAVRDIVRQEQEAMLLGQKSPQEALSAALARANETIADYNDRIGVG